MSDAQQTHDHAPDHMNEPDGPHEGPVKTPKQLILAVLYAFVVPVILIVLLVQYVTSEPRPAAGTQALTPAALATSAVRSPSDALTNSAKPAPMLSVP